MPVRYELLLRFDEQTGVLKGAAARYSDGSLMPIAPATLGDWLPDVLTEALTANAALQTQVAALTSERDTAVADLATRTAERDALQAQIDEAAASAVQTVPAHHLRRALRQFGMIAGVNAYMAALPDDDEMRESWEYAPYFRRDALGIESARVALGLTVGQVDGLFVAAGQIIT